MATYIYKHEHNYLQKVQDITFSYNSFCLPYNAEHSLKITYFVYSDSRCFYPTLQLMNGYDTGTQKA